MKKMLLCLFIAVASTTFGWSLKTGAYELSGDHGSGTRSYQGRVIILPQGENYRVIWEIGSQQVQVGVGIHRDWEGTFSVAYTNLLNDGWGIVCYKVGAFGVLEGKWTSFQGITQGSEKLTWQTYSTYPY
jgi:hypothetical protein